MFYLLIFLISTAGFTNFVVSWYAPLQRLKEKLKLDYKPFEVSKYKENGESELKIYFRELFNCPRCFGFWMGLIMGSIFLILGLIEITPFILFDMLILAMMGMVSSNYFSK